MLSSNTGARLYGGVSQTSDDLDSNNLSSDSDTVRVGIQILDRYLVGEWY